MAVSGVAEENRNIDEIKQYQMGRYISSNEAVWRIFSFPIHERHPTVVHLAVHLENGQRVYFTMENARAQAAQLPSTTLTAFFSVCQDDPFAKTLLYSEVPHISHGMHQLKNSNVANKVNQLKDMRMYFHLMHWAEFILFIRIMQCVFIYGCYWSTFVDEHHFKT